jgi:hypothetical protein
MNPRRGDPRTAPVRARVRTCGPIPSSHGRAKPRPAVKDTAMPGSVSARTSYGASPVFWPRLKAAATPKDARRRRSFSSASRVSPRCVWVSMIAGDDQRQPGESSHPSLGCALYQHRCQSLLMRSGWRTTRDSRSGHNGTSSPASAAVPRGSRLRRTSPESVAPRPISPAGREDPPQSRQARR